MRQWICLCEAFMRFIIWTSCHFHTVKCNDSVNFSFVFFLFSFIFIKEQQIASFLLSKLLCFWSVPCVYLFHRVTAIVLDCWLATDLDSFRVLHAVDSLNVKHELRFNSKAILYHVRLYLTVFLWLSFVCQLKIVFYFLHELRQRVVTSLDGINGRSIQTLLRE